MPELTSAPGERLARADEDGVRARIGSEGVDGLSGGNAEAAPLAGREPPEAVVAPELPPLGVEHGPFATFEPVAGQEVAVVVAGEEAGLLALAPRRGGKPGRARLGTRLVLPLLAEREPEPGQDARIHAGEHVRLVLLGIRPSGEE